ncbi:MAG TPA: glycosyltransferase family 9 protein [Gemmatimonadaceae bacterium]|jgi:ADP-heptose:LPS heptosyltransferase|nr:glycosyltransferase family 9 protein [Gemmatimonadaceae bacterium]
MISMRSRGKRAAALLVDRALALAARPWTTHRASARWPTHPRVLLIRCDHIGDAAMATAVVEPLRRSLQPSRLDALVGPWAAPLFDGDAAFDRVIAYATPWWLAARGASRLAQADAWRRLPALINTLRAEHYDIAIDLRGDLRQILFFLVFGGAPVRVSSDRTGGRELLTHVAKYDATRHEVEHEMAIVETLGVEMPGGGATLALGTLPPFPPETESRLAAHEGSGGLMVLALRGTDQNREWPAEQAAALVDRAAEELGLATVLVGGPRDVAIGPTVTAHARAPLLDLTGGLTLRQVAALCRRATVTVAVDSGPMHVAVAAGGAVVGLFGIGDPRRIGPWGARTAIATAGAPCGCTPPTCRYTDGPGRCMRDLTPDIVMRAVRSVASGCGADATKRQPG